MQQSPHPSEHAFTSLVELPALARCAGVARVLLKCENERLLGNFKSLGGLAAGRQLLKMPGNARRLICASDGNHGLAVALAAQEAGVAARVFLPADVPHYRRNRILDLGAEIVSVPEGYDAAVDMAGAASSRGEGILVPDTTQDLHDPVVSAVLAGYRTITDELLVQLASSGPQPTHLFVQAGVGGLAAAMTEGFAEGMLRPPLTIVVEPDVCACVGLAMSEGRTVKIEGPIHTCAEMLACGLASAPALQTLLANAAKAVSVSERDLSSAPLSLLKAGGPASTPSGAAGIAGLFHVAGDVARRRKYGIDPSSVVLMVVTEAAISNA